MKKWDKNHVLIILLIVTLSSFLLSLTILTNYANQQRVTSSTKAASILDNNCREGVYWATSQKDGTTIKCGRAPNCGGRSYDDVNGIGWQGAGKCWYHQALGVSKCDTTCKGYVPLCCYKLDETNDPEACNWPERGYCHPKQCEGVGERCGSPIVTYCRDIDKCVSSVDQIPLLPLSVRLGQGAPPATNTPTTPPAPPTNTQPPPQPTATIPPTNIPPQPGQPSPTPTLTSTPIPGQPTSTGLPTATRTPSPTQSSAQPTDSANPTVPPTQPPIANNPNPTDNPNTPIDESTAPIATNTPAPTIDWQTPKELAREVVTYERVEELNQKTDKPLQTVKKGYDTVKTYDQKLEQAAESWIFRIKIQLLKFLQEFK